MQLHFDMVGLIIGIDLYDIFLVKSSVFSSQNIWIYTPETLWFITQAPWTATTKLKAKSQTKTSSSALKFQILGDHFDAQNS